MLAFALISVVAAAPLPPECEAPATRDVSPLKAFAQASGSLSAGLDSVATWCFEGAGFYKAQAADCAKAIEGCLKAKEQLLPESRALLFDALSDMERPYLGSRYIPRRSGLAERPAELANCGSKIRSELYAQAQARMDVARLASLVQNEYANYRTWLFSEGLKCSEAVHATRVDPTRRGLSVDEAVVGAPLPVRDAGVDVVVAAKAGQGPVPYLQAGEADGGARQALAAKWRLFTEEQAQLEKDRDYVSGFLPSRELRDCRCQRPLPTAMVKRLESPELLDAVELEDAKAAPCQRCVFDAFVAWRKRADAQCKLMDQLSDFELGVLERSDDGNGLPPRCLERARAVRAPRPSTASPPKQSTQVVAVGAPPKLGPPAIAASTKPGPAPQVTTPPPGGSNLVIEPAHKTPAAAPAAVTEVTDPAGSRPSTAPIPHAIADNFVRPHEYAPVPVREDGRLYVRIFMSSACVAEVLPGPLQARTGDLLLIPYGAKSLSVSSPCGGLSEVYWGREATPRVSELFGRNQPLLLQFKAQ